VTTLAAAWIKGYGWLLLWLAVSLGAQALAYAGLGAVVIRKKDGRLPWTVRILLAPYMISARVTLHYYCRGLAPYAKAAPGVWLGRRLTDTQAQEAIQKGVTAALDLTAGFPECAPLLSIAYRNIQLLPVTRAALAWYRRICLRRAWRNRFARPLSGCAPSLRKSCWTMCGCGGPANSQWYYRGSKAA